MPSLTALEREWRRAPPAHRLVAAYFGYESPPEQSSDEEREEVRKALAEVLPIRTNVPRVDTSAFDAAIAATAASMANPSEEI